MRRITALMTIILLICFGMSSLGFAAGSYDMPGGYVAPTIKTSENISQFIDDLNKLPPEQQQQVLNDLAAAQTADQDTIRVKSFSIEGDDPLQVDPNKVLSQYLNQRLTLTQINKLVELLTVYYHQHDYPVAVVYLPQQEIKNGNVKFALLIGKFGDITLNNSSVVSNSAVMRQTYAIKSGDYITSSALEKALLLVNDLSMTDAKAALSPGKAVGTADLKITAFPDQAAKYGGNITLDNVGSKYTGQYEAGLGLYANNLTYNGDNLGINGMFGYQPDDRAVDTWTGAVSYRIPTAFLNGDLSASVSYVNYFLGGEFANLQDKGSSTIESLNWNYALQRSQLQNQNLQVRVNVKQLSDTQGAANSSTNSNVLEGALTYAGNIINRGYFTSLTTYNIGVTGGAWWTGGATNYVAQQNSSPGFVLASADLFHKVYFSDSWSADIDVSGQAAPVNLNPTDMFTLGGYTGVKAFAQGFAAGDTGALGKFNLRYNIPKPQLSWWPELQLIGFADAGTVQISANQIPGQQINTQAIGDYGLGLAVYSGINLNLEVDYARKMFYWDNANGPDNDQGEGNNNFLVHMNYSF